MSDSGSIKGGFLTDSSFYLMATVLSAAIFFLTLPIYTRYLSLADFGIVALFGMFGMVVSGLLSIGIQSATYRYYFKLKDDTDSFKVLNSTNLVFLFLVLCQFLSWLVCQLPSNLKLGLVSLIRFFFY